MTTTTTATLRAASAGTASGTGSRRCSWTPTTTRTTNDGRHLGDGGRGLPGRGLPGRALDPQGGGPAVRDRASQGVCSGEEPPGAAGDGARGVWAGPPD